MNKFFIFSTKICSLFVVFFFNFALAEQIPAKSNNKDFLKTRLLVEAIASDRYSFSDNKQEYLNNEARIDVVTQINLKNYFGYLNYRVQENPIQKSEIQKRAQGNSHGDNFFDNHFGLLREFYIGYNLGNISLYGGKFRPNFGEAFKIGRGAFTNEPSVDYMQLERVGAGFFVNAGNANIGKYKLDFSMYKLDRKYLDNTQITTRDPTRKSDAALADTGGLNSFNLALDVNFDFSKYEKLFYRFAYSKQAVDYKEMSKKIASNKISDQKGYAATIKYQNKITSDIDYDWLFEYVNIKNSEGNSDIFDQYINTNLITNIYQKYSLVSAFGSKKRIFKNQNGLDRYFSEFSLGYNFDKNDIYDNLQLQIGHKSLRINNKTSLDKENSYFVLLRYIKNF